MLNGIWPTLTEIVQTKAVYSRLVFVRQVAPLAQLDRASDYESEGYRFDSCGVYFFSPNSPELLHSAVNSGSGLQTLLWGLVATPVSRAFSLRIVELRFDDSCPNLAT